MTRRPRVPGITRRELVTDVPTGGDPIRALIRARDLLPVSPGEVWAFEVHHDTGCPAIEAGTDRCTCEVVHVHREASRVTGRPPAVHLDHDDAGHPAERTP